MSQHSVSGYLIAVAIKSNHTVLVEGVTDQQAIKYCLLKGESESKTYAGKIDVDVSDIIKGEGASFGSKDKVELIHSLSSGIKNKISFFVDREFEGFDIDNPDIDLHPDHKIKSDNLFLSRGHSLENYFFRPDFVNNYLHFMYATDLNPTFSELLKANWGELISCSATLSHAIYSNRVLRKCDNAFRKELWGELASGSFEIKKTKFAEMLSARTIDSQSIDAIWHDFINLKSKISPTKEACRWIAHGHVGHNILWTGIARLLQHSGLKESYCNEVCGKSLIMHKYMVDKWHSTCQNKSDEFPVTFFKRIFECIEE